MHLCLTMPIDLTGLICVFLTELLLFLTDQVPRESLLFIIPAFGGVVSWEGDGAPFKESDLSITYQVSIL